MKEYGHDVVAVGKRGGYIGHIKIQTGPPVEKDIHTVTMYINPSRQHQVIDYVLGLKPHRIIFNPGAENDAFATLARENNIEVLNECTLVMLRTNQF